MICIHNPEINSLFDIHFPAGHIWLSKAHTSINTRSCSTPNVPQRRIYADQRRWSKSTCVFYEPTWSIKKHTSFHTPAPATNISFSIIRPHADRFYNVNRLNLKLLYQSEPAVNDDKNVSTKSLDKNAELHAVTSKPIHKAASIHAMLYQNEGHATEQNKNLNRTVFRVPAGLIGK